MKNEETDLNPKPAEATTFVSHGEAETYAFAEKMARGFKGREVVLLSGELGAGKTVFAKGLAAGLEVRDVTQVCSPSYTLVNIYTGRFPVFHIDIYRLYDGNEILDLGWEDYLGEGVVIVEWAEKLSFPLDGIRISIEVGVNEERILSVRYPNGG